jgi:hypothetical protein
LEEEHTKEVNRLKGILAEKKNKLNIEVMEWKDNYDKEHYGNFDTVANENQTLKNELEELRKKYEIKEIELNNEQHAIFSLFFFSAKIPFKRFTSLVCSSSKRLISSSLFYIFSFFWVMEV